jgi:type IV pilus assembly protein PilA
MNVNPGGPPPQPKQGKSAMVIIIIVAAVVGGCCVTGILAAIAIPNFMKYQNRSKAAECKSELRKIYLAEISLYEEKKTYSTNFNELGVTPVGNRFTYFIGPDSVKNPSKEGSAAVSIDSLPALAGSAVVGVEGECPDCSFTAVCATNLDSDPTLDVWSISTAVRGDVPAGQVSHDADDLK